MPKTRKTRPKSRPRPWSRRTSTLENWVPRHSRPDDYKKIEPVPDLPPLTIIIKHVPCGIILRQCPFCLFHCPSANDLDYFNHIFDRHITFYKMHYFANSETTTCRTASYSVHPLLLQTIAHDGLVNRWCHEVRNRMNILDNTGIVLAYMEISFFSQTKKPPLLLCPFCLFSDAVDVREICRHIGIKHLNNFVCAVSTGYNYCIFND